MDNQKISLAARKALATINAPLPVHIGEEAFVSCLIGDLDDDPWTTHMRSFFEDVHTDTILDLVIEGTVTWDQLRSACVTWLMPDALVSIGECGLLTSDDLDRVQTRIELTASRFRHDAILKINPTDKGRARMEDTPTFALHALETLRQAIRRPTNG